MTHLRKLIAAIGIASLCGTAAFADCGAANNADLADSIAYGHAYSKHHAEFDNGAVVNGIAFPDEDITNANDFALFLLGILNTPSLNKALNNDRHAYWDTPTGTIIIENRNVDDCGTAFRPNDGVDYYNRQN
ncbi:hypothetical protein O2N63_15955 [Aliiroseovarius sp. KMU-50]|uniref:Uncharacterized protein n=1 Tax=Aliiroseovarius salicola TaxID=3009082 RepID=A0ABT4W5B8_9RHOB|nr:hypothetical protein [Aliiroseovarius sp. KMU-50]MDA5095584.1 hypothetical protein [Aliiroseovarius sp. KMU-50]